MDELWAIAQCYGLKPFPRELTPVWSQGAPSLAELFDHLQIPVTWFVVGQDLEDPQGTAASFLRHRLKKGDAVANHSMTHRLDFRKLPERELEREVRSAHDRIGEVLQVDPVGFRSPGYGFQPALIPLLQRLGYRYDSSICPSPFGGVFRWLDGALTRAVRKSGWAEEKPGTRIHPTRQKTQYSHLRDLTHPLRPHVLTGSSLWEYPTAIAPGLRLPFQAGICLRLGPGYSKAMTTAWKVLAPNTPLTFLVHGADLTDFSVTKHPFFVKSLFFGVDPVRRSTGLQEILKDLLTIRQPELLEGEDFCTKNALIEIIKS
jgi:hypothetical protein